MIHAVKQILACFALIALLFTCDLPEQEGLNRNLSSVDIIQGLASPIKAGLDATLIDLSDYIKSGTQVDSVTFFGAILEYNGSDEVHIYEWTSDRAMGVLRIWSKGFSYGIPVMRSELLRHTFSFDAQDRTYDTVQIKGEMSGWNTENLTYNPESKLYELQMVLEPGDYQYIMVLEGQEILDNTNPVSIDNGIGGFNSLLSFGDSNQNSPKLRAYLNQDKIDFHTSTGAEVLVLWNNQVLALNQEKDAWSLSIPELAKDVDRSHLRAWAINERGISNDLLIPLDRGVPIQNVAALNRTDKHAMRLYNVFVDRFANGDPSNDRPLEMESVHPRADDHGGDIRGAIDKLEAGFFDSLNVNTIWISPIVKNVEGVWGAWPDPETKFSAYHGYWPISFTLIDNRKGTAAELHELVDKAHARGINVLLDFVANHVHEDHPFYKNNPEYATDLYLPDGRLNTELWDEQRLTTWFDVFLPTLKLDEPAVYETLSDSAVFWITEYDLDGFRHDATKHVPEIFWKTLTRKLKEQVIANGKDLYQIGETYGTPDLISSYVNSGQLDAQFDFNVYDAIVASLCQDEVGFERLDDEISNSLKTYGHHHLMGNITGNQDRGRFISYAGGALRFDENSKVAGWSREVGVGDTLAYEKSKLLMAITATIPGLPVIYYGDEIGSYGGNDPDNRKMMRFEHLTDKERELQAETRALLSIRKESIPLIYGDFRSHFVDGASYVFSRNYLGQSVFVLLNNSATPQKISFPMDQDQSISWKVGRNGAKIIRENGMISIEIPPYAYELLF
jgi:glycosidase